MKNKAKWIKRIIFWILGLGGVTIFSIGIALTCDADLGSWTQQAAVGSDGLSAGQIAGIAFFIGFALGVTVLVWYPISRLLAWAKTRTLKNKNLEMDLKLKEQELEAKSTKAKKE